MVNFTLVLQIGMLFLGLFLFLNLFEMKLFKRVSTMAPETVKSPNVCVWQDLWCHKSKGFDLKGVREKEKYTLNWKSQAVISAGLVFCLSFSFIF